MNVLIVCANGMTSSSLCQKTREVIQQKGIQDIKIGSCGIHEITKYAPMADLVLLAPQISYMEEKIKKLTYINYKLLPSNVYEKDSGDIIFEIILNKDKKESKKQSFFLKVKTLISKFTTNDYFLSIYNGMYATFMITVIGSIFTLLRSFPITQWQSFIQNSILDTFFAYGYDMTIGMYAFYVCIFVAKSMAEYRNQNIQGTMISSIISFFLLTEAIHNHTIDITYFDVKGLFVALFTALFISRLYQFIMDTMQVKFQVHQLRIAIQQTLISIIPVTICVLSSICITCIFHYFTNTSFPSFVYSSLETYITPLIGSNIYANLIVNFLAISFWFFGIHGGKVVGTVTDSLFKMYSLTNLQAFQSSQPLPYIVTSATSSIYVFGGAGSTLALCILMAAFSKSQKYKNLGKIALPMGIFFINEPILFGIPFVMNPIMLIPFLTIPLWSGFCTVTLMSLGILPKCIGFDIPWTTPPIISGFIQGGWQLACWQVIMLLMQLLLWYPFFRKLDQKEFKKEKP